jgi:hypothetical protein
LPLRRGEPIVKRRLWILLPALAAAAYGQENLSGVAASPPGPSRIDSIFAARARAAAAAERVIVEFSDEPMLLAARRLTPLQKPVSPGRYTEVFARFRTDLGGMRKMLPASPAPVPIVIHEFYRAFFGASLALPRDVLPSVQKLSYVKAVHFDREVHALTDPAVSLIGADGVWNEFGTRGEGIRVGVIDTGIDYLHPALGAGFGVGFKVAGGYDVVNNDGDPTDDNGHGTHVAGLIAADADTFKGVAPHATLFAFKALDASGSGLESDIIAAIERAVDPDQDGNPTDRMDVINLSLGSAGGAPTDPSAVAVNNAVTLGIVACVAAGNAGGPTPVEGKEENYFYDGSASIGSPGTAELAITVGASDPADKPARFSSKGPVRLSFAVKPDVLAPGVNILSTFPNSTYAALNGTSMSTPMVAGTAALVRSLHPAWTPAQVKSAIVNRALDLGASAFVQGGGRVRALKSVAPGTLVVPSAASFGMDDPSGPFWIRRDTLTVYNAGPAPQSYSSSSAGTVPGVSLNIVPAVFPIAAGDSARVVVMLTVDNSLILNEPENILRYSGAISFNGTIDTVAVPWGFARTSRLVVTTSEPNAFFFGVSSGASIFSVGQAVNWTSPTRAEIYAPVKGTYEFVSIFRDPAGTSRMVFSEGVGITTDDAAVTLNAAEATLPLVFHGVDHSGNALTGYPLVRRTLVASIPQFGDWVTTFTGGSDTLLLSPASAAHSFKPVEYQSSLATTGSMHVIQFDRFSGMASWKELVNSPTEFIRETIRTKVPPGTVRATHVTLLYAYKEVEGSGALSGLASSLDTMEVGEGEYSFTAYLGKSHAAAEDVAANFFTSFSDFAKLSLDYQFPLIMPYGDSVITGDRALASPAVPRYENGGSITVGGAPFLLETLWYNGTFGANTLHFRPLSRGMLGEYRQVDLLGGAYSVYDKNRVKLFTKSLAEPRGPLELTPDPYTVEITAAGSWLGHAKETGTLSSTFDLAQGLDAMAPSITSILLRDGAQRVSNRLSAGEGGTLLFSFNMIGFSGSALPSFDSIKAWYRRHGTVPWTPLVLAKVADNPAIEGVIVRADLTGATAVDSVAIDLRLASAGPNGSSTEFVVAPAFAVGNWDTLLVAGGIADGGDGFPGTFALAQNFPNPFNPSTTIRLTLPDREYATLRVYDILGREVGTLFAGTRPPGTHEVTWDASRCASGVYVCRLVSGTRMLSRKMILLR